MSASRADSQLVRERALQSRRVREVLAAAVQAVARLDLGLELMNSEAWELAQTGSVTEPIDQLRTRLERRRTHPEAMLDQKAQERIAVAEAVADLSGVFVDDPAGRIRYVRDLVEHAAAQQRVRSKLGDEARRIDALLVEIESTGGRSYRRLVRRVARLWSHQRSRLHAVIMDDAMLARAEARLEEVYLRHLREFLSG